jgi:DNA replication protein DnaC
VALVQPLYQAERDPSLMAAMSRLEKYRFIITDDTGYVKSDAETDALFAFIAHRNESGTLTVTANHPFSQWDRILLTAN